MPRFSVLHWLFIGIIFLFNIITPLLTSDESSLPLLICGNLLLIPGTLILLNLIRKVRDVQFSIAAFLLSLIISFIALSPVTVQSGWPVNHEVYFWKYRMICYYQHFLQLDFFPLWSSGDSFGLGSPLPMYYHKLIYLIVASIFMFIGSVKTTFIITIFIFELIGIAGIYRCLRLSGIKQYTSLALALLFPLMNYTFTDWLIRGNMAEFSALCIAPWLIVWCLELIVHKHFNWNIILLMTLLLWAHNIIAYFGVFIIAISVFISLLSKQPTVTIIVRSIVSVMTFLLINSIVLIPMILISDYYNPGKIKYGMEVVNRFERFGDYFLDRDYIWGKTWHHISPEINTILTAFLIFFLGSYLLQNVRNKDDVINLFKSKLKSGKILFIGISTLFLFYLQHESSSWFYGLIPGADFIQFPWRLLSYIQILVILIMGYLLQNQDSQWIKPKVGAFLLLFSMTFTYPFLKHFNEDYWSWYSNSEIEKIENKGTWGTGGEYIPDVEGVMFTDHVYFSRLSQLGTYSEPGTTIEEVPLRNPEELHRKFRVNAVNESIVVVPINYSGLESAYIYIDHKKTELEAFRIDKDPRIRLRIPPGNYLLQVNLPTLRTAFGKLF